jgi:hypothetical protein
MPEKANRFEQAWAEAVAKVWKEGSGEFRTKLLRDPKAAFAELGAEIPQGVDVRVIESSRSQVYFVLPPKPGELKDISDENLDELYRACPGTVCQ